MKFSLFSFESARSKAELLPDTGKRLPRTVVPPTDAAALDLIAWKRKTGGASPFKFANGRGARAYDAALTTLQSADFFISQSSANAEVNVSVLQVNSRSRKLARDNPYAKGGLRLKRNNVVGHKEFRLEMAVAKKGKSSRRPTTDQDAADKVENAWREAGKPENCTVKGDLSRLELYLQAYTSSLVSGAVIARHWRGFAENKFGYAIQPLEIDRLDPTFQGFCDNKDGTKNPIRFSIERDRRTGRAIKYWILSRHPGDITGFYVGEGLDANLFRVGVPAAEIIYFNNFRDRPEQERGMSELDTIVQRLHRIDQWDVAYETACIWRACNSAFLTREMPTGVEYQADEESEEGDQIDNSEPGTTRMLPPGFKMLANDTKFPVEAAEAFKVDCLRGVASGFGVPYYDLSQDLERVNFSSGRLGAMAARDQYMVEQELFISGYVFPHFAEWLRYALLTRAIDLPVSRYDELLAAASFNGRRWGMINPLQDAQAAILLLEAGLDSRDNLIKTSERGGDVEEVDAEIEHGRDVDKEHKLDFTGLDPTKPTIPKGEPGQTAPNPAGPSQEETPPKPPQSNGAQKSRILTPERLALFTEMEKLWEDKPRERRNGNGKH
jgi:lambda family phage portal protein